MSAAGEVVSVPTLPAPPAPGAPRPRRTRQVLSETAATDAARWHDVMKLVAWHIHDLRDLLGLSQDQLAMRAGVSQGAVSRMEGGRCSETPLLTYARVVAAFCQQLGPLREQLRPEVRGMLELVERLLVVDGGPREPLALFDDPPFQSLLRVYGKLEPPDRADYAEMAETLGRWMLERMESKA